MEAIVSTNSIAVSSSKRLLLSAELEDAVGDDSEVLVLRNMLLYKLAKDNRKEIQDVLVRFYWGDSERMASMPMNDRLRSAFIRCLPIPEVDEVVSYRIARSNDTEIVVCGGISKKSRVADGVRVLSGSRYSVSLIFKKMDDKESPLWLPWKENSGL